MASAHVDGEQGTRRHMTKPARKSPAARLQLSVTENEVQQQKEIIRKVTKAHEVVEVDGFLFKRKRRIPLGDSDNTQASAKKSKLPQKIRESSAEAEDRAHEQEAAETPQDEHAVHCATAEPPAAAERQGVHEVQGQPALQQQAPTVDVTEAAEAALASLPRDCGSEAERLLALCKKLVEDEAASAEGAPGAELLRKMLDGFLVDVRASLGNGTLQCRDTVSQEAAAAENRKRLRSELEAQKAVLSVRLDRFLQEETEWKALLESSRAVAEGAASAAAAPADAELAVGQFSEDIAAGPEPDVRTAEGNGGSDAAELRSDVHEGAERPPGLLQQAQLEAHRGLTLQTEGLSAMVEGVRELVAAADQIISTEFDKLYKEKFSALPGLNSPARLIREITRPPHSRLQAASSVDGQGGSPSMPAA